MKKAILTFFTLFFLTFSTFASQVKFKTDLGFAYAFKNAELDSQPKLLADFQVKYNQFSSEFGYCQSFENNVFYFKQDYRFLTLNGENTTQKFYLNTLWSFTNTFDYCLEWDIYANFAYSVSRSFFTFGVEAGIGTKNNFIDGVDKTLNDFLVDYKLSFDFELPWNADVIIVLSSYDTYRFPLPLCPESSLLYVQKINSFNTFVIEQNVSSSDKFTTLQYVDFVETKFYWRLTW